MPEGTGTAGFIGFSGGLLLSTMSNLSHHDLISTALLAAIGAASSFAMTLLCRWIYNLLKRK